jgi:hypothetical protein
MIDRLIEIGGYCEMEINVEETKVVRISSGSISIIGYDRSETTGECGIFQPFG